MSWLLDTNVISELRTGDRCDPRVRELFDGFDEEELFLSVLVIGEVRRGIELIRRRDPRQAAVLERWLGRVLRDFGERVLPVDRRVAETWGRMSASRPLSTVDGLLAATALVHDLTLVTRNAKHVEKTGAQTLDPWSS